MFIPICRILTKYLSIAAIFCLLCSCAISKPADHNFPSAEPIPSSPQSSIYPEHSELPTAAPSSPGEYTKIPSPSPSPDLQTEKNGTDQTGTSNHEGQQTESSITPDQPQSGSWNPKLPSLAGISIGDTKEQLYTAYGRELDMYELTDGHELLTVMEYDGLSIGFDSNQSVHFVELYGKQVHSRLNQLRIGDRLEQVTHKLGKPNRQTESVITFNGSNAVLKIDLDPASDEVVSIKLLPDFKPSK